MRNKDKWVVERNEWNLKVALKIIEKQLINEQYYLCESNPDKQGAIKNRSIEFYKLNYWEPIVGKGGKFQLVSVLESGTARKAPELASLFQKYGFEEVLRFASRICGEPSRKDPPLYALLPDILPPPSLPSGSLSLSQNDGGKLSCCNVVDEIKETQLIKSNSNLILTLIRRCLSYLKKIFLENKNA